MKNFTKFAISVLLISNTSFHAETLDFQSLENQISNYPVEMQQEIKNRLNQNNIRSNVQYNGSYQQETSQRFNQDWDQEQNNRHFNPKGPKTNPEMEEFLNNNPELKAIFEELKNLAPEDRKAAMQELQAQYPELAQMKSSKGQRRKKGQQNLQMKEFFQNNPQLKAQMDEIRNLSPEDRKAAMQELQAQYPELAQMKPNKGQRGQIGQQNPQSPLSPQINQTSENFNKQGRTGQKQRGSKTSPQMQEFIQNNPDFQSKMAEIKQLPQEERRKAMQELQAQYPELQQMKPERQGRRQGNRRNQSSRNRF